MKIIVSHSGTVHASSGRDLRYPGRCRTLCSMHIKGDEIDGREASDVTCVVCQRALAEAEVAKQRILKWECGPLPPGGAV